MSQDSSQWFTGKATYYDFSGRGNCSFAPPSSPVLTAAINTAQYAGSELCGACLEVKGAKGTVVVRVEDRCPGCPYGSLDLSMTAFGSIDELAKGRIPISWRVVPCLDSSEVTFYVEKGSNAYFAQIRIQGNALPVQTVEMLIDSTYRSLQRRMHGCFEIRGKHGPDVDLRVVSAGDTLLVRGLRLTPGASCKPREQIWIRHRPHQSHPED